MVGRLKGTRLSLGRGWSLESRWHASGRLDDVPADAIVRVVHPYPAPLSEDGDECVGRPDSAAVE